MKNCKNCNTDILDDARFCHNCGSQVVETFTACPNCNTSNSDNNKYCSVCGFNFLIEKNTLQVYRSKFPLDFSNSHLVSDQVKIYFFRFFKEKIKNEFDLNIYDQYLKRFYESDFGKNFEMRMQHLAEESYSIHARQNEGSKKQIDQLLEKSFENQLDHFMVYYCKDLNPVELPEEMLAYESATKDDLDLQTMILHFLDLEKEKETFYTDFIVMPISKLKNASQAFLFPEKDEKIMIIADQTIFGSCKEGFALTEKGIYWKAHFEKPKKVLYHQIQSIKKEKDWISINGNFFNVNPSINLKIMKLLKKLSSF